MMIALGFLLATAVIVVTGANLCRYGDAIADRSGLGRTWIGVVLLASVTSLPELVTGASSVLAFDLPDIAAGDAIGSCQFNLLILAALDLRHPMPIATRIQQGHVLSAAFGILLLTITASGVISGSAVPALGWIGIHSVLLLIVYLIAMRIIYRYEAAQMRKLGDVAEELGTTKMSLRRAIVGYALNSVGLMAAAIWLPWLADGLAEMTGLGRTFVGTLFVATSTSLPEVVVSVTAARIGAVDMAAGNLFGSNLFNMFVIGLDDVLMVKGPMLGAVEPSHLIALGGAIGMTAIAIIGMTYRAASKRHRLSWDAVGMVLVYGLSALLLAQR